MTLASRRLGPVGAVPPPPVSVIRPHDRDLKALTRLLAAEHVVADSLVFNPSAAENVERWSEARSASADRGVAVIVDTLGAEVTAPGTTDQYVPKAPWGGAWANGDVSEATDLMVEFAATADVDGLLAPAPVVPATPTSLAVVERRLGLLRDRLDASGLQHVQLHYPLVGRLEDLRRHLAALLRELPQLPIASVWLRVHRMGASASVKSIRQYVTLARELHATQLPLIGDRAGVFGVGLTAFGAIGGVTSGVTMGERTDVRAMQRPPRPPRPGQKPFMPAPRIYVHQLGMYLTRKQAESFYNVRGHKAQYACADACCGGGFADTMADPRRHFLRQRYLEVHRRDGVPVHLRADHWVDRWLRPASDHTHRIARRTGEHVRHADHVATWRDACSAQLEADRAFGPTISTSPSIELRPHAGGSEPASGQV